MEVNRDGYSIPYGRQLIEDDDIEAVVDVLRSDWLTTGPVVTKYEQAFAAKVGSEYAVACSSGTAALHLAALAIGLESGATAVVPTMTFLATANCVVYTGGDVIFADCDPSTGLLGPAEFSAAIDSSNTTIKAVFPVHMNGHCVDMGSIYTIALEHNIFVIEDASHALGSEYKTKDNICHPIGACHHSNISIFSMHPVKTITMGEGGMLTTNNAEIYKKLIHLRNHGMVREASDLTNERLAYDGKGAVNPWYYEMPTLGYNYRASAIHCALGLSQLKKLDQFVSRRQDLTRYYHKLLEPLSSYIKYLPAPVYSKSALHLYAVHIDFAALGRSRAEFMLHMEKKGIGTQVHYIPVHWQPYYTRRYGKKKLRGAEAYYEHCISLPLFPGMTEKDIEYIVMAIKEIVSGKKNISI